MLKDHTKPRNARILAIPHVRGMYYMYVVVTDLRTKTSVQVILRTDMSRAQLMDAFAPSAKNGYAFSETKFHDVKIVADCTVVHGNLFSIALHGKNFELTVHQFKTVRAVTVKGGKYFL